MNPRYQHLTVLWALGEVGLGGILHATGIPLSGLLVGGWSVACIALMALQGASGKDILTSLGQVLLVKLALSPHAPPTAYMAVAFQGLLGAAVFSWLPWRVGVMLLAVLSQVESAAQRLLTLTLFVGTSWVEGLNGLGASVARQVPFLEGLSAYPLIGVWLGFHACAGVAIAIWLYHFPQKSQQLPPLPTVSAPSFSSASHRSKKWLHILTGAIIIALSVWASSASWQWLLLRVAIVAIVWFGLIPYGMQWLRQRFRGKSRDMIDAVEQQRYSIGYVWQATASLSRNRWQRLQLTAYYMLSGATVSSPNRADLAHPHDEDR